MAGSNLGRLPLRPDGEAPELDAVFAEVAATSASVPNLYRALAHAPEMLRSWIDYAWSLRTDAGVSRGVRELAILRLAQRCRCDYVWRSHWRPARRAGYEREKLHALGTWPESTETFTAPERAALALADEMAVGVSVSDGTWGLLTAQFDRQQVVELILTVGWYANVVRVVSALDVPLEDDHERAPGVPTDSRGSSPA